MCLINKVLILGLSLAVWPDQVFALLPLKQVHQYKFPLLSTIEYFTQAGDDPGLKEYVDSYMQAAQDWFDNIQESKINAYMELYDTLLENPTLKV